LTELIGAGSVISAEERSLVITALRSLKRCPLSGATVDAELLEAASALESRLMSDEIVSLEAASKEAV
jgi:hypothetical protein